VRRLRPSRIAQRFGIAAPRVAVRTQLAWYWRWLVIVVSAALVIVLARWLYDAGRRVAGFDRLEIEQEIVKLRSDLGDRSAELDKFRAAVDAADSRLAIERAAQRKLADQVQSLEKQNTLLREDLAIFESMLSSGPRDAQSLVIQRFQIEPGGAPGEYRYRMMLFSPGRRAERNFQGRLELTVKLSAAGRGAMMNLPDKAGSEAFQLSFRQFRRVEGTFRIAAGARIESVQARVFESGSDQVKATQTVNPG
jgi:hypothetical protein